MRSKFADQFLSSHERWDAERAGFRQPLIRAWLARELWEPFMTEMLGRYPPGHRYHQDNPLLRYYPAAMTLLFVGGLVVGC